MVKILTAFYFIICFGSCYNESVDSTTDQEPEVKANDTQSYKALQGTWIRHNEEGFTLIEIKDTANVLYYQFIDRKAGTGIVKSNRYWYYKSKATLGYRDGNNTAIWISTDKFRFDYTLKGDTLIEFDKTGEQGKLIRVLSDKY